MLPRLPLAYAALSRVTPSPIISPPRRAVSGLGDPGREEQAGDLKWGLPKAGMSLHPHLGPQGGGEAALGRAGLGMEGPEGYQALLGPPKNIPSKLQAPLLLCLCSLGALWSGFSVLYHHTEPNRGSVHPDSAPGDRVACHLLYTSMAMAWVSQRPPCG